MINNVVLVSGVQQSDSIIYIHVSVLFQILFPFRLYYCTFFMSQRVNKISHTHQFMLPNRETKPSQTTIMVHAYSQSRISLLILTVCRQLVIHLIHYECIIKEH